MNCVETVDHLDLVGREPSDVVDVAFLDDALWSSEGSASARKTPSVWASAAITGTIGVPSVILAPARWSATARWSMSMDSVSIVQLISWFASGCAGVDHGEVRVIGLTGCTALALGACALGTASGAPRVDSGVRGLVLYGPTCPVERPGRSCVRPYQASITVKREPAGTVVAHVHSVATGRFSVRLRAGRYLLVPRNGKPFPRARSRSVSVHSHRFTAVTITFDSGIR